MVVVILYYTVVIFQLKNRIADVSLWYFLWAQKWNVILIPELKKASQVNATMFLSVVIKSIQIKPLHNKLEALVRKSILLIFEEHRWLLIFINSLVFSFLFGGVYGIWEVNRGIWGLIQELIVVRLLLIQLFVLSQS